jgi:uncharacterized protein YndB with AHSA1/START domain
MADLEISHVYDASPEAVFKAWTEPEQVARWWAPEGISIPPESIVIDAQVGGRFELTMVDPSGNSYDLRATYVELVEPELIVMRSEPIPAAGIAETQTRVTFEAEGDGCRMTIADGPYTDEVIGNTEAGWRSLVANLEGLLAEAAA